MQNPKEWLGMRWPDSDAVSLLYRHGKPTPGTHLPAFDIGCGAGRHLPVLDALGYLPMGIDSNAAMIGAAHANIGAVLWCGDAKTFNFPVKPHLVLAWGFTMLEPDAPTILAKLGAEIIVCDWRSPHNQWGHTRCRDFLTEADTAIVYIDAPDSHLNGLSYWVYGKDRCLIPGYDRIELRETRRYEHNGDVNAWYQTAFRRAK